MYDYQIRFAGPYDRTGISRGNFREDQRMKLRSIVIAVIAASLLGSVSARAWWTYYDPAFSHYFNWPWSLYGYGYWNPEFFQPPKYQWGLLESCWQWTPEGYRNRCALNQ
jgi:hypothetical protein